jgi:hypothetical protein
LTGGADEVRWAPRIPRQVIRRLYDTDARGRLDEELLDEVFFGFLARCEGIVTATEAGFGRVRCPRCAQVIVRRGHDKDEVVRCERCAWQTTWGAYLRTYQGKQLSGGNAIGVFREFLRRAPTAQSAPEKMLLVDWLVHQVHKTVVSGQEDFHRPAAVNLIEGSVRRVTAFLNELAYGTGSTPEVRAEGARWRQTVLPHLRRSFRALVDE